MINRPNLENLIKELKELQLDQARIQSRQTEIIDLLSTAHQGSTEDDKRAQGTQAAEQEDTPPQAAASETQTNF